MKIREKIFGRVLLLCVLAVAGNGDAMAQLDLKDTYYFGSHPSNIVPMQGYLPDQKQEMLAAIRETREQLHPHLNEFPKRGGEGSILNR